MNIRDKIKRQKPNLGIELEHLFHKKIYNNQ